MGKKHFAGLFFYSCPKCQKQTIGRAGGPDYGTDLTLEGVPVQAAWAGNFARPKASGLADLPSAPH